MFDAALLPEGQAMNGVIFNEIEKFGRHQLGDEAWQQLVTSAELPRNVYVPITDYPDAELATLVSALSVATGKPPAMLLGAFGEFLAPDLIRMAQHFIEPNWKTIELVANTEGAIHSVYRGSKTNTHPPELECHKLSEHEVVVIYRSSRKMCPLAKGIVRGMAKHFGETVVIREPKCMLKGDDACELVITVV
jgi:predicted hydrocarbon binding protein